MVAARICPSVRGVRLSNGSASFGMTTGPHLVPPDQGMDHHDPARPSLTAAPDHRAPREPDSPQPAADIDRETVHLALLVPQEGDDSQVGGFLHVSKFVADG